MWKSPDGKIQKEIIINGMFGQKPTENSECIIFITDTSLDVTKYNNFSVVIGDVYSYFDKLLHICLQTMCQGEIAKVSLNVNPQIEQFTLELKSFICKDLIYQWNASRKYDLALDHKNKGVQLFKDNIYTAASFRFGKALKLLSSIPIDVERPPEEVDGIFIKDINSLKVVLYNNLAFCYLKHKKYEIVIRLCKTALNIDKNNIKAMYRCAVAYYEERNYETAIDIFKSILIIEPENKSAIDMLKSANKKLTEADKKVNDMFKKMFIQ